MTAHPGQAVSAIVCTRNRARALERTLRAFGGVQLAGVGPFELLVVDNGSTDDTLAVVEAFAANAPFPVHKITERRQGQCFARNAGLAHASGSVFLLTDDDCYVAPDWVQVGAKLLHDDPMRVVGGRVELFDHANLPLSYKSDPAPDTLTSTGGLFYFLLGANLAFGRAVVDRIGGFDVRLGPGSAFHAADDTDFVYRAYRAGIPIAYEPAMVVHHDHGRAGPSVRYRLLRGYAEGTGAMLAKSLLAGRTDLLRPIYWDLRSTARAWRTDPADWRAAAAKWGFVTGAARFLVRASWKNPAGA